MKKNTYQFYVLLHNFLALQPHPELPTIKDIVEFAKTCEGLSWEATEESVEFLERSVNRSSTIDDDDAWMDALNEFIVSAFKDLSSLRDPKGMELFGKLHKKTSNAAIDENIVWTRKVIGRQDGSAVVILHVADYEKFKKLVEKPTGYGDLEAGKIIFA